MGVTFRWTHLLNSVQIILLWMSTSTSKWTVVCGETTTFPIYKQEEAIRAAKSREVLQYMNLSVNPCEDFYEYACGNWPKYHLPPAGKEDGQTIKTILEEKIEEDLHNLLDENVTLEDSAAARRVKVFYKSCLDARQGEASHQAFLSDFIKSNGGFPAIPGSNWLAHHHNYDWQHVVAILRYNYGLSILIGMDVDNNYQTMEENSLYMQEPSTMIPRSLCNAKTSQLIDVTDKAYDMVEQEVADNLRLWLSMKKEDALHVAADMVTFEHDLCKAMYIHSSAEEEEEFIGSLKPENRTKNYERKTLNNFTQQFNNTLDFNAIVSNSFGVGVTKPVFMKSPKYFEQLIHVIEETEEYNKTVVANYIMYRALTYFNFPLNDTPRNRPAYCLQVVKKYFPKVLGDIYYRKYANTMDQHKLNRVFEQLKKIMEESLNKEWIEESTRRLGKKRLSQLSLQFPNYEKFSLNLEFVRNDFWKNLRLIMGEVRAHEVNRLFSAEKPMPTDEVQAYETRMVYRSYHQRIDIGWGVLQAPYYQAALPHGMRYAMIGQKLAQTLATGFDDLGWTADNPDHKIWDTHTAVEYYKQANCFTEQIGNYLYNDPFGFQNATKIRRLVAQSVGLSTAFNAYLDWLFYKNPSNDHEMLSKETLPELDFTNTQLFFIGFAQAHCESRKKPKKLDPLKYQRISPYSKHSLARYQVNGPLTNFIEFSREFHCPIGSEMNVADKCIIY
ncbi:neprilysin-4 [Musca vetustissima]|uniref:neprilysin-4 n=1 Tax=Musca vetustissima TaxID=27455 RepID=UPI002AB60F99|nr:neprilysin-4 [Musca vetustissima]